MMGAHICCGCRLAGYAAPAALEEVRDYCKSYNRGRKGAFSEFKRAFIAVVIDHLNDARLRERRLYYRITGEDPDTEPL